MAEHSLLQVALLDPNKLIKVNELQEIRNPIFFVREGVPTTDGLLSNEIFGISKDQRANIFGYINLEQDFINPLVYKIWHGMDRAIKEIVHGTKRYIIKGGMFVEDEEGETGIDFLKKNLDKIKIKQTDSFKRDVNIDFINKNKDLIFMNKLIVIPAYYRDVNSSQGNIGVGEINKLYDSVLIGINALRETADYGLSISNSSRGRVQELILEIYNWFTKEPNLAKKQGIIKRAVMSKTADYASRLVLSAPELKVEKLEDLQVDTDHCAVPLASLCSNLFPQMIFWVRRFFENEFSGTNLYPYIEKETKEIKYMKVKDPLIEFSDARIKKELDRFIHGYSNRFIPIKIPNEENKNVFMKFKGRSVDPKDANKENMGNSQLLNRKLTWCDLFYMAAIESSKDKCILLTRYPLDNIYGQFPQKVVVSSTTKTEPVFYDTTLYKHYPKIREDDIGSDTSNKFVDTLKMSNLHLGSIGGDYRRFLI